MKKIFKRILAVTACSALGASLMLAGCSGAPSKYVVSIEKMTENNGEEVFAVMYSDGSQSEFSVSAGKDGQNGKDGIAGLNGQKGEDGQDVDINDVYERYVEEYGEISYSEFLKLYLTLNADDSYFNAKNMLSVAKVYSEFVETKSYMVGFGKYQTVSDIAVSAGSAVVWSVDSSDDGYTYLVTNYHVVYDSNADTNKNGGNIARNINVYFYGSEGVPEKKSETDADGYTVYDYGEYAVGCEYVGGSIEADIAVLKAPTEAVKAVNENITPVTLADSFYVGQTAIAIGNPENEGISVTRGIVSVESEYIALKIDNTARYYRSVRIDTALYSGNSGGGLFNSEGKLIGITNAGDDEDQNINFAIPIEIVKGTVENILFYYNGIQPSQVKKINPGINVASRNSKYVLDGSTGYGKIIEEVVIESLTEGSIASALNLVEGDVITSVSVNGNDNKVVRTFNISDILLYVRAGDEISFKYKRGDYESETSFYTVSSSDLSLVC